MQTLRLTLTLLAILATGSSSVAQSGSALSPDMELRFVVYLSRHGVRSPTGKTKQYSQYSAAPWPEWDVPPGYLTPHGYDLMRLFGAYDRSRLASLGLLSPEGCDDAARVTVVADSDQRTRETGKALAEGMFPKCAPPVQARAEGTDDPLFHPLTELTEGQRAIATAAIAGRIGGDPKNLAAAYHSQLEALDRILASCGHADANATRTSILDVPPLLETGTGDHPATLRGPLSTASTLSENLLLEYTQGMTGNNLAWGCLDKASLNYVLQLHSAAADVSERTPVIAQMYSSNLLNQILKELAQSASGKPVEGALSKPGDRVLFLVGHDTNIAAVAGALGLNWIIDGRRDDTPPGGALIFELWKSRTSGMFRVRVDYTAQTLDQMRETRPLTAADPPELVPVFVPDCSKPDGACDFSIFKSLLQTSSRGQSLRGPVMRSRCEQAK